MSITAHVNHTVPLHVSFHSACKVEGKGHKWTNQPPLIGSSRWHFETSCRHICMCGGYGEVL